MNGKLCSLPVLQQGKYPSLDNKEKEAAQIGVHPFFRRGKKYPRGGIQGALLAY